MEGQTLKRGSCSNNNVVLNSECEGSVSFYFAFMLTYILKHGGGSFRPGWLSHLRQHCAILSAY